MNDYYQNKDERSCRGVATQILFTIIAVIGTIIVMLVANSCDMVARQEIDQAKFEQTCLEYQKVVEEYQAQVDIYKKQCKELQVTQSTTGWLLYRNGWLMGYYAAQTGIQNVDRQLSVDSIHLAKIIIK